MQIIHQDNRIIVCCKPAGVLSTDEPGGLPELVRAALGDSKACVKTVHRLDRVVGGLMVLARSRVAAQLLSQQMAQGEFEKEYLAVCHGAPAEETGRMEDPLRRAPAERKTYVTHTPGPDAQPASLSYRVLEQRDGRSLVAIRLHTGRTHQIRCQFASRGLPLVGDRKYGTDDGCPIALWSHALGFRHPQSDEALRFFLPPPDAAPWDSFSSDMRGVGFAVLK